MKLRDPFGYASFKMSIRYQNKDVVPAMDGIWNQGLGPDT